jgi:hypothetical protein
MLRKSGAVTLLSLCTVRRGQEKTYLYLSPSSQTPTVYALPVTPIIIPLQSKRYKWDTILPCFNLSFLNIAIKFQIE